MAFSEIEVARHNKEISEYVDSIRPPMHIRKQLDISFRIQGHSIEIFEVRPKWDDPSELLENSVAKTTYFKSQNLWKLYWRRADLKWHGYEPYPQAETLSEVIEVIKADEHACFWG